MKSSHTTPAPDSPNSAPSESPADGSFLSRWSRRKAAVREGRAVAPEPAVAPAPVAPARQASPAPADVRERPPAPTLADVALLKPGEAIERFVARGVDEQVKRAALKTLFADPHFNVMDGLDIYIDDYTKPDPIPPDVLRRLTQSETLGLFDPVEDEPRRQHEPAAQAEAEDAGREAATQGHAATGDEAGEPGETTLAEAPASGTDAAREQPAAPTPLPDPGKPA